jgi:hypothetical protein
MKNLPFQSTNVNNTVRPIKLPPPETATDFQMWSEIINKNFPACVTAAEACAATMAQLLINDITNPFALALVDAPASAKTITLNFFDVPELAYTTDTFTAASFVSSSSNVPKELLNKIDMLPRIRFRTLILRDLAPMFGNKSEDLTKIIGILIRVLDGEGLQVDSGTHGRREYSGDYTFMLLAGTTPLSEGIFTIMGKLGSRLFFLKMNSPDKTIDELVEQNIGEAHQDKVAECKSATTNLFRTLWQKSPDGIAWNKQNDDKELMRAIALCACLLSRARAVVERAKDSDEKFDDVLIEKPNRINQLLYNFCRGHAVICGRTQIDAGDVALAVQVTLDSSHKKRATLIRGLIENNGGLKTSEVEDLLKCSKPTALEQMEILAYIGIAEQAEHNGKAGRPEGKIKLAKEFQWFLSPECSRIRGETVRAHTG